MSLSPCLFVLGHSRKGVIFTWSPPLQRTVWGSREVVVRIGLRLESGVRRDG